MTHRTAPQTTWFKSSYSAENGTACIEVAALHPTPRIAIRDSKNPDGPVLTVSANAFAAFVNTATAGSR